MKRWKTIRILLLLVMLASVTGASGSKNQASQQSGRGELPDGNWKISFEPYRGPGYDDAPVQVISVNGYVNKSGIFFIQATTLRNNTGNDVDSLVYTCYVYDKRKPDTILVQQRMIPRSIKFNGGKLAAKMDRPGIIWMGWSFSVGRNSLFGSLIKDGKLEGSYRIALGITGVVFKDGSEWEMPDEGKGKGKEKEEN